MGVIETKTFKSGNSVAVRLPKELGLGAGIKVRIENRDGVLTIKTITDAEREKQKVTELVAAINAIWDGKERPISSPADERIEFPDRPGLY